MTSIKRPRPGTVLIIATVVTAFAAPASGSSTLPVAKLQVSQTRALQLRPVAFNASKSSAASGIRAYTFAYGDGIVETTGQPFMLHAYSRPGRFHARVTITDAHGVSTTSTAVTIRVRDGVPPIVRIDHPKPNQHVRLSPSGVTISGSAHDPGPGASGVRRVQIAVQYLSIGGPGCYWYDGQHSLAVRVCGRPLFFGVGRHGRRWSFRLDPAIRFPAGVYAVRVRAIDHAGNVSQWYAVRLRTILGFFLAP